MPKDPYRRFSIILRDSKLDELGVIYTLNDALNEYNYVDLHKEFCNFIKKNISLITKYQISSTIVLSSIVTIDNYHKHLYDNLFNCICENYLKVTENMIINEYRNINTSAMMSYIRIAYEKDIDVIHPVKLLLSYIKKINNESETMSSKEVINDIRNSTDVLNKIYQDQDLEFIHDNLDREIQIMLRRVCRNPS